MKTLADESVKQELLRRVQSLRHDSQRRWGRMTPHQMLCHLNDSFKLALGEVRLKVIGNIFHRTFIKGLALYTPIPWPHGIPTMPEMDQEKQGTPPVEFTRDMAELVTIIERIHRPTRDFAWGRHPIFNEMSDWEWLRWGYLHVDHHLRQFGV